MTTFEQALEYAKDAVARGDLKRYFVERDGFGERYIIGRCPDTFTDFIYWKPQPEDYFPDADNY